MARSTLSRRLPAIVASVVLAAGFAGPAAAEEAGITLAIADWVPQRDPSYGGWGVVSTGGDIAEPLAWTADAASLALAPGSYDVYWVQDYETRGAPMLLAASVAVAEGATAIVAATSGMALQAATWVPALDQSYGWWGAVRAGDEPDVRVNWTRDPTAPLLLPPGGYDVYWVQDYETRDTPLLLAADVKVAADTVATVVADAGIALETAAWVPALDESYGWWGAVKAGEAAHARLNWTRSSDALLVPPGAYDVYWVQDYDTRDAPMLLAAGVEVDAGTLAALTADSGLRLDTADWVPPLDASYGWWGAAPAGAGADARVNWTRIADAMLLPPGAYDVYWVQDYDTRDLPLLLAAGVEVAAGAATPVAATSGIALAVADWVPPRDQSYGWWGAAPAGGSPDQPASLTRTADALLLPPGDYDVYWVQGYDTRDNPLMLAHSVAVAAGSLATVAADAGVALDAAAEMPALEESYGWWGAAPAGSGPEARVNWRIGTAAEPLLLPPGRYDVFWTQGRSGETVTLAQALEVAAGILARVGTVAEAEDGGWLSGPDAAFTVVFDSDDFADPTSGWTEIAGEAAELGYGKGDYRIVFSGPSPWMLGSAGVRVADALVAVDAVAVAGSAGHPYGLYLRGQDDRNYHAFVIAADGSYAAFHLKDGLFGMDGPPDQYLPAGAYRAGGVNRLAVRAERGALHYLLNDVPVVTIPAALWPAGTVGVIAANPTASWAEVHFDNWQVLVTE